MTKILPKLPDHLKYDAFGPVVQGTNVSPDFFDAVGIDPVDVVKSGIRVHLTATSDITIESGDERPGAKIPVSAGDRVREALAERIGQAAPRPAAFA